MHFFFSFFFSMNTLCCVVEPKPAQAQCMVPESACTVSVMYSNILNTPHSEFVGPGAFECLLCVLEKFPADTQPQNFEIVLLFWRFPMILRPITSSSQNENLKLSIWAVIRGWRTLRFSPHMTWLEKVEHWQACSAVLWRIQHQSMIRESMYQASVTLS